MALYNITSEKLNNWTLFGYPLYLDFINSRFEELSKIISFVEETNKEDPFKWAVEIGSIQFLVGVYPDEKELRLVSKQLNYELNILTQTSEAGFKEHATKVAELPLANSPMVIEYLSFHKGLPLFEDENFKQVHEKEQEIAAELISQVKTYRQSLFEKISDFGLDMTANYMLVRVHVLKFLAILPNLEHDKDGDEVKRIFLESLRRLVDDSLLATRKGLKGQKRGLPNFYIAVTKAVLKISSVLPPKVLAFCLRRSVSTMAKRFIAGENINKAASSLSQLRSGHRDSTIDQLGELVVSEYEADQYFEKVIEIIKGINKGNSKGEKNKAGIYRSHVSIKVSALAHDFKPQDFQYTYDQVSPRLSKILLAAKSNEVFINIDAEHYSVRDIVFDVYSKVLLETDELKDFDQTGIVVQAYLRDGIDHLNEVIALAKKRGVKMPIRLVKGAYWDAEVIESEAHNFIAPQFLNKEETDIHFRQLIYKSLEAGEQIVLAVASHNIQDHSFSRALREVRFPDAPVPEHQCLHMTYEALSVGLSKMGWATRNYIPVGDLLVGMAYLVRRIMENSSQVGVLTIMRSHNKGNLFRVPYEVLQDKKFTNEYVNDPALNILTKEFKNVFPVRSYLKNHFDLCASQLDKDIKDLNSGKLYLDEGDVRVVSSSDPELLIGKLKFDTPEEVETKINNLFEGYKTNTWKTDTAQRFSSLHRLADLMLVKREELTTLIMVEAGKTIDEATADVDEAIDFVNFYIREQSLVSESGLYSARGVVGVIAPWNFPLAIPCGMTVAALVAGNSAILKPAEQTSIIAHKFVQLCYEAGIPKEVLQMVKGEGKVGASIVDHKLIVGIVFTGSRAVGEMIYRKISVQQTPKEYGYEPINKFAITEMGGKNAIIVTNNCELDETVSGIIYSAFAHAGQKCSAASRVIIDNQIKDAFLNRFVKAIEDIKVGSSLNFSTMVNPLISKEDALRVGTMAKKAVTECHKHNGVVHIDRSQEKFDNYCVAPSLFELPMEVVLNEDTVATQEVFGPLIHLVGYNTLDEALTIFNSTDYALTGGIFAQSQDDIDYLVPQMEAGNIYINRPNTGARVAIEPFGGFKMSGTGPKAGGHDYLFQFNKLEEVDAKDPLRYDSPELQEIPYFAHPSKLSIERRLYNAKSLTESLIKQFEVFFSKITDEEKQKLVNLRQSIIDGEFNLGEREFPNRDIPGQISYSKKDMQLGSGFIVDDKEFLDVQAVIDILINLIVGNGLTILTTNFSAYEKWQEFIKVCYLNGFSAYNLSLGIVGLESLEQIFKEQDYQFVIFTGKDVHQNFKNIIYAKENPSWLVKIFTTGYRENWEQGIDTFTHTRSFAINTMRHGAPLELSL